MTFTKVTAPAVAIVLLFETAGWCQLPGGLFEGPYAGALIDDTHVADNCSAPKCSPRFAIVMVGGEAILLDAITGRTWHLVFDETNTALAWESLRRKRKPGSFHPPRGQEKLETKERRSDHGARPKEPIEDPFVEEESETGTF